MFEIVDLEDQKSRNTMRLWSLHPKYLDARGLVALWREGLLAQAVLRGNTKGYVNHPQLIRFREADAPVGLLAEYLTVVQHESINRGYRFDGARISRARTRHRLRVTRGQLDLEWNHLLRKLSIRDPKAHERLLGLGGRPRAHPLFRVVAGGVASWERAAP
ncbi:MAG: pyrimidine dimer DNA glycosylase/endonuclease V [Gemmatimonadota bacterium]